MKKIGVILLALAVFNTSFAASKNDSKVDTTFTFQDFVPTSDDVVSSTLKTMDSDGSNVSYPVFSGEEKIVTTMNKNMNKFVSKFKGSKNVTYNVSYTISGSNAYFVSVLFDVTKTDNKNNTTVKYNEAISFNTKNGKVLELKDLFVPGYNDALNSAIQDKIKQFGINTYDTGKKKFEGIKKSHQNFYLEDDALVIFFNQDQATDFGNGQLFIPFITRDLIGILK